MRRAALMVVLALLTACSSGGSPGVTSVPGPTSTQLPAATTTTTTTEEKATLTTPPTVSAPSTSVVTVSAEPLFPGLDLAPISLVTPGSGEGPRPMLRWEPVDGAATYTVLVMDAGGERWWSWSGSETEVVLGGVDTQSDVGGPVAGDGVTWVVFAFDPDDVLVGVSSRRNLRE